MYAKFLRRYNIFDIFVKNCAMPVNKNALLRYKTIDNCLRNRGRRWTLQDLIDACSNALYEYTGKDEYVSCRTIQLDIQKMRSDELGYNAPIVIKDKKYYTYEDPDYSITNIPITEKDISLMSDAVNVLKQLSGFSMLSGMEDIISRLEDKVNFVRHESTPIIFYEKNDHLVGLEHIGSLYGAIRDKRPLEITYQSFRADHPSRFIFSPFILKEYKNRWFVFGHREDFTNITNLALDRIIEISAAPADAEYTADRGFDPESYFGEMIGVTRDEKDKPCRIKLRVSAEQAPYVLTKPMHSTQRLLKTNPDGSVVLEMSVILNRELLRFLVSMSNGVRVLSPKRLVNEIRSWLDSAREMYQ